MFLLAKHHLIHICRIFATVIIAFYNQSIIAQPACEVDHLYIGGRPDNANPGWHENAQGISHDDAHWYITQPGRLWKIPATHDLGSATKCGRDGVLCRNLKDTDLFTKDAEYLGFNFYRRYNHLGDLTFYRGLLCVPVEFKGKKKDSLIAIFRASNLELIAVAPLPLLQGTAGWCAVDQAGTAYFSKSKTSSLMRYKVDWDTISNETVEIEPLGEVLLLNEDGNTLELETMQGGVFSDNGLLYLTSGSARSCNECGIHVFEVRKSDSREACGVEPGECQALRLDRSSNGVGSFDYEVHPGWSKYEEPEGVTYWDLEANEAPSVPGTTSGDQPVDSSQLHAILLDNDYPSADEVYVKHYRADANENCVHQTHEEEGESDDPSQLQLLKAFLTIIN